MVASSLHQDGFSRDPKILLQSNCLVHPTLMDCCCLVHDCIPRWWCSGGQSWMGRSLLAPQLDFPRRPLIPRLVCHEGKSRQVLQMGSTGLVELRRRWCRRHLAKTARRVCWLLNKLTFRNSIWFDAIWAQLFSSQTLSSSDTTVNKTFVN